jgi:hypothetical protein
LNEEFKKGEETKANSEIQTWDLTKLEEDSQRQIKKEKEEKEKRLAAKISTDS